MRKKTSGEEGITSQIAKTMVGGLVGFSLFWVLSHDEVFTIKHKLPKRKIRRFHYLPNLRIELPGEKHLHLHHWALAGLLYAPYRLFMAKKVQSRLLDGLFAGTIVQGLIYKDRFQFIKRVSELTNPPMLHQDPQKQP